MQLQGYCIFCKMKQSSRVQIISFPIGNAIVFQHEVNESDKDNGVSQPYICSINYV